MRARVERVSFPTISDFVLYISNMIVSIHGPDNVSESDYVADAGFMVLMMPYLESQWLCAPLFDRRCLKGTDFDWRQLVGEDSREYQRQQKAHTMSIFDDAGVTEADVLRSTA